MQQVIVSAARWTQDKRDTTDEISEANTENLHETIQIQKLRFISVDILWRV